MYIIKTISKSKKDGSKKYYTYRLMESIRVGKKVKKVTLLNLGSDFSVEQEQWAVLSKRINEIINQTPVLFELDKDLEELAQQYAMRLVMLKAKRSPVDVDSGDISEEDKYKAIDVTTIKNSDPKKVGIEHVLYETIKELQLDTKLEELGFTNVAKISAIGTIIAKIANPSSDIKSYRWLCNKSATNELLDCDFNKISSNNIYRVADKLLEHKDTLEEHLYNRQKDIFEFDETITLYDLTNTYFEGGAKGVEKAKRGRSKEKRSDAPLITLGVMLDSSGFVRKSEIFDGNISEPTTFKGMLDKFKLKPKDQNLLNMKKSLVVMDAGIASQENIDYLIENNYEYIVVSRKKKKEFDKSKAVPVKLNNKEEVIVKAVKVVNEETKEIELFVHSCTKELKEKSMQNRVQKIFIEKLQYLKDGLPVKRRTKEYEKVCEAVGRLKERYSTIAQYYNIKVQKDPNGINAIDITWEEKISLENKTALNGVYCLRSNCTNLDEKTLWKTYTTLTDLEAVFRSLKSELGLRPIFHQKQSRVDGHIFITLLAYSIVHTIRYKLKQNSIHYSLDTIKEILENSCRVTTSMKCKDNTTLYIRQSTELNEEQKEIHDVLKIKYQAGGITRVYID
jgi:hypothetical protein